MATVQNVSWPRRPVILDGGRLLSPGDTATGIDPAGPVVAAEIIAGDLAVIAGGSVPPPTTYEDVLLRSDGVIVDADSLQPVDIGGAPAQVAIGNVGASYTLAVASRRNVWATGTLTANATITVADLAAGSQFRLILSQDATGGRTLTIGDGSSTIPVPVPSAASARFLVNGYFDGTDLTLEVA